VFSDFSSVSQKHKKEQKNHNNAERQAGTGIGLPLGAVVFSFLILTILIIHACASVASAQVPKPSTTQSVSVENDKVGGDRPDSSSSDSYGAWGQLLLAMVIVVGLIVGLGWLLKRLSGGKALHNAGALKLIARANLSAKHQMFLVRMGNRMVLIGAGPQGLSTLSEITDPAEAADLLRAAGFKDTNEEGGKA
jgi:flagellar biogenesis protein FliO